MQAPTERPSNDSTRRRIATMGLAGATLAISAVVGTPAFADSHGSAHSGGHGASETKSGHNPPGNNGTVFIHDVAGDHSPHNVPHVSCNFYVDFFGFDKDQSVTVSFAGQAPTGAGTQLGGTWTGVVSTTDAGGAGNDFDDELAFTADQLGVSSLGAPAHQGYHVKMTVATNEPGGKKSKVFWIAPCTSGGSTGGTSGGTGGTSGGTGAVGGTGETTGGASGAGGVSGTGTVAGGTSGGATVLGTTATKTTSGTGASGASGAPGARVLGEHFTRGASSSGVAGLPFTGAEIGLMSAAGLGALGAGGALAVAGRRRRRRTVLS